MKLWNINKFSFIVKKNTKLRTHTHHHEYSYFNIFLYTDTYHARKGKNSLSLSIIFFSSSHTCVLFFPLTFLLFLYFKSIIFCVFFYKTFFNPSYKPAGCVVIHFAERTAPIANTSLLVARCVISTRSPGPAKCILCSPNTSPKRKA